MTAQQRPVVGIDLGTTNSLIAYLDHGVPRLIRDGSGQALFPSVVALDDQERLIVGRAAKELLLASPTRAVAEAKRLMGTSERVMLGARTYSATEISAMVLRALKESAEAELGATVDEAVVTVPAYFTDAQRKATKDAGELAGLRVERILNEPTAAALAYGVDHLDKEELILVYDLGGGTFDVSILEMFDGVLEVKASAGNNRLGGGDFDRALVAYLVREIERQHGVDARADVTAMVRLRAAAEAAKIELSTVHATRVLVPEVVSAKGGRATLDLELTREVLEGLVRDLADATISPIEAALTDARVDKKRIGAIVLVGGATRMPLIRRLVGDLFGRDPLTHVHPDEAVALGAAIQGGLKSGAIKTDQGIMITDVCPFTLGVEVQAAAGSQHVDGMFSPIIPRNSTIPVSRTEVYSTTRDQQTKVDIRIFQGESRLCKHNVFLDVYTVDGIPPAPAGREKVAVTFTYDVNGILQATTKVVSTGKEATLRVERSQNRLTPDARADAKARLEREWGTPSAAAPRADVGAGLREVVAAARARMGELRDADRARIGALLVEADGALASGDPDAALRVEARLTDALVEVG